jgi:hypothetical protein
MFLKFRTNYWLSYMQFQKLSSIGASSISWNAACCLNLEGECCEWDNNDQ